MSAHPEPPLKSEHDAGDAHTIPVPVPSAILSKMVTPQPEHEHRAISEYVELEADGETVTHAEKIKSEHVLGRTYDIWDVHTDQDRYWVLTNLTNLYSQKHFPSMDYMLSFHIGLMARMMAQQERSSPPDQSDRLTAAWRRWEQAAEALDEADEAEAFQGVGVRCRECLISFVRALADRTLVPDGQEEPKAAAFLPWAELIAESVAAGDRGKDVRLYLKSLARSVWQLVNWLTHTTSATRFDAELVVDATRNILDAFGFALIRKERGLPDRCP